MRVDPRERRSGVGTRPVEAVLNRAGERGARTVYLSVSEDEEGAVAFYRALGFRGTTKRFAVFEDRFAPLGDEPISEHRFVAVEMEAPALRGTGGPPARPRGSPARRRDR